MIKNPKISQASSLLIHWTNNNNEIKDDTIIIPNLTAYEQITNRQNLVIKHLGHSKIVNPTNQTPTKPHKPFTITTLEHVKEKGGTKRRQTRWTQNILKNPHYDVLTLLD